MEEMNDTYLLLGTNVGDRIKNLQLARNLLATKAGNIIASSGIYKTAPWGNTDQADFFNQAVHLQTMMPAETLMQEILNIEMEMGRERTLKNAPRIIDIDILLFNDVITDLPHLHIPHALLHERKFALIPLQEIAGDLIHPVLNLSINQLSEDCKDELQVSLYQPKSD